MARGMGALRKRNRDRLLSDDSAVNRRIREYGAARVATCALGRTLHFALKRYSTISIPPLHFPPQGCRRQQPSALVSIGKPGVLGIREVVQGGWPGWSPNCARRTSTRHPSFHLTHPPTLPVGSMGPLIQVSRAFFSSRFGRGSAVSDLAGEPCWCAWRAPERGPTANAWCDRHLQIGGPHIPMWGMGGAAAGFPLATAARQARTGTKPHYPGVQLKNKKTS